MTEPDFPGKIKIWAFGPSDVISRPYLMILDPGGKLYLPEMVIELMVDIRRDIDVFIQ